MTKAELEKRTEMLGRAVGKQLPEGVGFALVTYDIGETGHMAYIANGDRHDVMALFRELGQHMENDAEGAVLAARRAVPPIRIGRRPLDYDETAIICAAVDVLAGLAIDLPLEAGESVKASDIAARLKNEITKAVAARLQ